MDGLIKLGIIILVMSLVTIYLMFIYKDKPHNH